MKKIILPAILTAIIITGCTKSNISSTPLASLNIINAVAGQGTVKANFSDLSAKTGAEQYYQINTSIAYGSNTPYSVLSNQTVPLSIVPASDTTSAIYSTHLSLISGGVYSLFLAGQPGAVDTVFVKETIPYYTDTTCGVRFINLSAGSQPVNVTMTATPAVNEFAGVAYKQLTAFNKYPSGKANTSYSFQVWDAGKDSLLLTYNLATPYFHNVTLVLRGLENGTPGLGITRVNNY